MAKAEESPLVAAATLLERDLQKLEELSSAVCKMRLHNERSIARAARELNVALEQPDRLAQGLRLLAEAMGRLQERQQAALVPLGVRAAEIQARAALLNDYIGRFAALGTEAAETSQLLQSIELTEAPEGTSNGVRAGKLAEADQRLAAIVDGARELAEAARNDDLPDFVRDADALKQQIQALRGRLKVAVH